MTRPNFSYIVGKVEEKRKQLLDGLSMIDLTKADSSIAPIMRLSGNNISSADRRRSGTTTLTVAVEQSTTGTANPQVIDDKPSEH
jgi:hypothetical protein